MITIVTGQPRSGTSMVMRVLDMGGIKAEFSPNVNAKLNPYGSFETNKLKDFQISDGKCVKVLMANNLFDVPEGNYKVIMPVRNTEQIVLSRMEKFNGKIMPQHVTPQKKQVEKEYNFVKFIVKNRPDMELLEIPYEDFFTNTDKVMEDIKNFLGVDFDIEAAKTAVDKTLYKVRTKEKEVVKIAPKIDVEE